MKKQSIIPSLLAASVLMIASQIFASENPTIVATILNPLEGEAVPAGTTALSNINRINSKIVFDRKEYINLPPISETVINPEPANVPDNYIVIQAIETSTGAVIPVKVSKYKVSEDDGNEVIEVAIEILEENNVRQNKVHSYLDEVQNEQSLIPGEESQEVLDMLIARKADLAFMLNDLYSENQIGNFTLTFKYHSTQVESWAGHVESLPIAVQIIDKGSFFDILE